MSKNLRIPGYFPFLFAVILLNSDSFKDLAVDLQYILVAVSHNPSSRDAGLLLRLWICEPAHIWEEEEQL